ncbi:uncharacterized protein LOC134210361 [Armigeres subalbatus]|uniref:uncharacterized protein LOC134210361 n=1 Tax=Armigeres subalbatus TaxID=124917 RepID=UPI002ED341AB
MAAASSGDPGGSVGRRLPNYMDPTNKFGELTFLQLTAKDGATLPINPFIIGKTVEACAGGAIESAKTEAQGTKYTLCVRDPAQVTKLLKLKSLIDGTDVEVIPHPNLNTSRCVISCFELIYMEEKDILTELINENVVRVQRITRNEGGKKVNTPALILTFCKTTFPEFIKVGLLRVPTRPYFPNPMLCYGCFSYGHTRIRCPGPQRCFNCSDNFHGEECDKAPSCQNCKGNHRPTNRQCPVYKKEVEVIKIKVRNNLSFPEARKRAEQQIGNSYAQAAAQQTVIERKLKELEMAMMKKDKEIARLHEESKRKDERIEQMTAIVNQIKIRQQIGKIKQNQDYETISNEKPHHSHEQRPVHMTIGVTTRSRNNSPVVQERRTTSEKQSHQTGNLTRP